MATPRRPPPPRDPRVQRAVATAFDVLPNSRSQARSARAHRRGARTATYQAALASMIRGSGKSLGGGLVRTGGCRHCRGLCSSPVPENFDALLLWARRTGQWIPCFPSAARLSSAPRFQILRPLAIHRS
jgi:hypothetical protein